MAEFDLAVHGGVIVTPQGRVALSLYVRQGRVAHLGTDRLAAAREVDAQGLFVLPGMVDTHVHLMEPGETERETFPDGTAAAATRGVTTIIEHTHHHPVRSVEDLREKLAHLESRSRVDFGLAAHVWPDRINGLPALWEAGIGCFKIFTCTTHGVPGLDPAHLHRTLRLLAAIGGVALMHCEDESMTAEAERILREAGRADEGVITEWRSREAELTAVAVASLLVGLTGARATIAHVSSQPVARLIETMRSPTAQLYAEACPQYFLLREWEVLEHGALRKFTPPARARSDADEEEMWDLLRTGILTHVSSDHAPSTRAQKAHGDIWEAPFGLPGLDTTMQVLLDAALRGRLTLEDLARVYSEVPAQIYGLFPRKGSLAVEADADFVLIDPHAESVIRDEDCLSKAGWSPFSGRPVRGRVVATFLRGEDIAREGEPRDGFLGRFLPGPGLRRQ
jgi:dihydroorotase (multifunctional complex type)